MDLVRRYFPLVCALCISLLAAVAVAAQPSAAYEPKSGQPGKDVVWVPTPDNLVEKMLDIAELTPRDFVIDLGSGDGRAVIAAARRGVPALGVEYDDKLVELARERAAEAGVAGKARFVQGDMYEADISRASVLILFLLEDNLDRLAPKFLAMPPGSRIAINTYTVSGWTPDRTERIDKNCDVWCTAHLYIVPAKADGSWRLGEGTLTLRQNFQMLHGTMTRRGELSQISDGRLRGDRISFSIDGVRYEGRVAGDKIMGEAGGKSWTASRVRAMN